MPRVRFGDRVVEMSKRQFDDYRIRMSRQGMKIDVTIEPLPSRFLFVVATPDGGWTLSDRAVELDLEGREI